jgi:hypothetical protein
MVTKLIDGSVDAQKTIDRDEHTFLMLLLIQTMVAD